MGGRGQCKKKGERKKGETPHNSERESHASQSKKCLRNPPISSPRKNVHTGIQAYSDNWGFGAHGEGGTPGSILLPQRGHILLVSFISLYIYKLNRT